MSESDILDIFAALSPLVAGLIVLAHIAGYLALRWWLNRRLLANTGTTIAEYTPGKISPMIGGILLDRSFKNAHAVAGVYELIVKDIISLGRKEEGGTSLLTLECRYPIFTLKEMGLSLWQLRLKAMLFENDTVITQQVARARLVKGWLTLWRDAKDMIRPWFTTEPNRMLHRRVITAFLIFPLYLGVGYVAGYAQTNAIPFFAMILSGIILWYATWSLPLPWLYTAEGYATLKKLSGWKHYYTVVEHDRSVFEERAGKHPELFAWSIVLFGSRAWEHRLFSVFAAKVKTIE